MSKNMGVSLIGSDAGRLFLKVNVPSIVESVYIFGKIIFFGRYSFCFSNCESHF